LLRWHPSVNGAVATDLIWDRCEETQEQGATMTAKRDRKGKFVFVDKDVKLRIKPSKDSQYMRLDLLLHRDTVRKIMKEMQKWLS
jgi:hypothetical protein